MKHEAATRARGSCGARPVSWTLQDDRDVIYNSKCAKCGQPATHKFTRIHNGQVFDLFLCQQHAAELSPYQKQSNLSEILEGLLKQEIQIKVTATVGEVPLSGLRCRNCGLPIEAYRRNFILGCSVCYDSFREILEQDLRKFHGSVRHLGRRPGGGKMQFPTDEAAAAVTDHPLATATAGALASQQKLREMLESLQRKLDRAIEAEDFEKAALYRDQIRELKQKIQL